MSGLQEFLSALRSKNIAEANDVYETALFNGYIQVEGQKEDAPEGDGQTSDNSSISTVANSDSPSSIDTTALPVEDKETADVRPTDNSNTPSISPVKASSELDSMDAAAVLPDSNILEEFKSVQSMINDARAQEKINDPATLKAIRTKHKELLSKLIDSAMEE